MNSLFPEPLPPPRLDPERIGPARRSLQERLTETLQNLGEEIELRRTGSLGEAQAAGYIAGRLQRADSQAAVGSFRTGAGRELGIVLSLLLAIVGSTIALGWSQQELQWLGLILLVGSLALLYGEVEGYSSLSRFFGQYNSQSVAGVRAAVSSTRRRHLRVVLIAPLDGVPAIPPRPILFALLQIYVIEALLTCILLIFPNVATWWMHAAGLCLLLMVGGWLFTSQLLKGPRPALLGAGELAVLIAVPEELGELQQVELWSVALGAGTAGDDGIRHLLTHYPFGPETCFINLHHLISGQPVFVTREGIFHEYRAGRELLSLASGADLANTSINAEPRQLRQRTLATLLFRRGYPTITITSHTDTQGLQNPDPGTLERCVKLITGMIRELDQERT